MPRPQAKRPRACRNCQKLRQKANEKDWRERNPGIYDANYHTIKKKVREARIEEISIKATACLSRGALLVGLCIDSLKIGAKILKLLLFVGLREINKLWPEESSIKPVTCSTALGGDFSKQVERL